MKTYKYLMMCIMAASVAMYGCSSDDEPNKEEQKRENNENVTPAKARMQLTDEQDAISLAETKVAFKFFESVYDKHRADENVLTSPLSKDILFGMVTNALYDADRADILEVYGASTMESVNDFNSKRLEYFAYDTETAKVFFANSIWANSLLMTDQPAFMAMADNQKKNYKAETTILDFGKEDVRALINKWCSTHTQGLIPELLKKEVEKVIQSVFVNTIYFKCPWKSEFDKKDTKSEGFYDYAGTTQIKKVQMMKGWRSVAAITNNRMSAFAFPYSGCNYSAVFVLPAEGLTIKDILGDVEDMLISRTLDNVKETPYHIGVPRFQTDSNEDITSAVEATGVSFDNKGLIGYGRINSSRTLQAVNLIVDESGTRAAAASATLFVISNGSGDKNPYEIMLNRPFLMIVKDDNHGSILLMAAIQMPKE